LKYRVVFIVISREGEKMDKEIDEKEERIKDQIDEIIALEMSIRTGKLKETDTVNLEILEIKRKNLMRLLCKSGNCNF
jgi:hypothetical protein